MTTPSMEVTAPRRLYAANMWMYFTFENGQPRCDRFLASAKPVFKSLLEGALLYDEIVVPTQDFLALTVLVGILGKQAVIELVESETLKFVRLKGTFAYANNDLGVVAFHMSGEGKEYPFCAPTEQAITVALTSAPGQSNDPGFVRKILDATTEVRAMELENVLRQETMNDIKSTYLRSHFAMCDDLRSRYAELGRAQAEAKMHIMTDKHGESDAPEIYGIISVLRMNLDLWLAQHVGCVDGTSSGPIGHVLKGKTERSLAGQAATTSFATLRQVADLPDLGAGIMAGQIKVDQLIKLAKTRRGEQFRQWFHDACRDDPILVAKEYVTLLREIPRAQSLPIRILRFLAVNAVGLIPGFGTVANFTIGVVDSFFIESWLKGNSPKYFIDDLRQLAPPQVSAMK